LRHDRIVNADLVLCTAHMHDRKHILCVFGWGPSTSAGNPYMLKHPCRCSPASSMRNATKHTLEVALGVSFVSVLLI
jgi:hypothetical protein